MRESRRRLHELHAACGEPSNAELRRVVCGFSVPRLAAATLSEFVRDIRPTVLPRQDFVRAFVAGCLLYSKATPEAVRDRLKQWDLWWIAVVTSSGQPPIAVITPQEPKKQQAPSDKDHTQDHVNTSETAARTVGQTVLLADRGPHSKPIQDRRIELRTQKHPEHSWILWAHLAETPSTLDRLWLDWSYQEDPDNQDEFRQCGAQPVSDGPDTPALLARDSEGRPRWFRACGQVYPAEQRAPDDYGSYCTSWTRPRVWYPD
ncbi:MAG: hypothetical protein ACRDTC_21390 [Pseudonocardiaceae bacterium]